MHSWFQFLLIAAHLNRDNADEWVQLAEMSLDQGNEAQALSCYNRGISLFEHILFCISLYVRLSKCFSNYTFLFSWKRIVQKINMIALSSKKQDIIWLLCVTCLLANMNSSPCCSIAIRLEKSIPLYWARCDLLEKAGEDRKVMENHQAILKLYTPQQGQEYFKLALHLAQV